MRILCDQYSHFKIKDLLRKCTKLSRILNDTLHIVTKIIYDRWLCKNLKLINSNNNLMRLGFFYIFYFIFSTAIRNENILTNN